MHFLTSNKLLSCCMKVTEALLDNNDMHDKIMAEYAQNKTPPEKGLTDIPCTHLAHHEPESITIDMLLFLLILLLALLLFFLLSLLLLLLMLLNVVVVIIIIVIVIIIVIYYHYHCCCYL